MLHLNTLRLWTVLFISYVFVCMTLSANAAPYEPPPIFSPGFSNPEIHSTDYVFPVQYHADYDVTPERPSEQLFDDESTEEYLTHVVNWVAYFLGVIGLLYLIIAGFTWVTALDKEEQITKAKNMIAQVVIGTIVVLASYAIVVTIISLRGRLFFY